MGAACWLLAGRKRSGQRFAEASLISRCNKGRLLDAFYQSVAFG